MDALSTFVRYEVWVVLIAALLVVGMKLVDGSISTRGLLSDKGTSARLSPGRVQMLAMTVTVAGYCLAEVAEHPQKLPEIPNELVALLLGSHTIYLGGKLHSVLRSIQKGE